MKKSHSKGATSPNKRYVTKRVITSAVGSAVRKASSNAMTSMGYVVKAENGWVVREDSNGIVRKISKIVRAYPSTVVLD
jgi:hypothetical protein